MCSIRIDLILLPGGRFVKRCPPPAVTGFRLQYKESMKCLQVGLVGFGFAGRIFHSNAIAAVEGLELAAIVQRSGSEAAAAFPHAKVLPTIEDLLKDTSIRLVVVATPNASHLPI